MVSTRWTCRAPAALFSDSHASWTFTVDTRAPAIRITKGSLEARRGAGYTLRGALEPSARVRVNGKLAPVDEQGRFEVAFARAPTRTVVVLAHDQAGNATDSRFKVATAPRLPRSPVRAVHVSADAWAHDGLRADVLKLLREKRINTVELDLKDELGIVGWRSGVPLARRIGAERNTYDLGAAVKLLHARGARVVGRLVAFRDPVLAEWAWTHGRRDLVIQTPEGGAYSGGYGGFTSYVHPTVRAYNVDLAVAAAKLGVDDVLYDYVRRPDGPLDSMVVPGLDEDPEQAVTDFLAQARRRLAPHDTFLGASVFGIAATRPEEIAQDVPDIAREVDYVAPMLYPSHWGPQEYGVANPESEPYAIVRRSLVDFQRIVRGTGARVVPWLQDFSLGVQYGEPEVRAQIDAAKRGRHRRVPALGSERHVHGRGARDRRRAAGCRIAHVRTGFRPARHAAAVTLARRPRAGAASSRTSSASFRCSCTTSCSRTAAAPYDLTPDEFRAELQRLYDGGLPAGDSVGARDREDRPSPRRDAGGADVRRLDEEPGGAASGRPHRSGLGRRDHARVRARSPRLPACGHVLRQPRSRSGPIRGPGSSRSGYSRSASSSATTRSTTLASTSSRDDGVQRQIVLGNRLIRELAPDAEIATIALPFGLLPSRRELALRGSWDGEEYEFAGAFLAGAEPSPSPISRSFDPAEIPRIRTDPGDLLNGSSDWLARLDASPELRYVSDGQALAAEAAEDGEWILRA